MSNRVLSWLAAGALMTGSALTACSSNTEPGAVDQRAATTSTELETSTTEPAKPTGSRVVNDSAPCAIAELPGGGTVSELTCNAAGTRAVGTVRGTPECPTACAGYFLARGTTWELQGVRPATDPFAADQFADWRTLWTGWQGTYQAITTPTVSRPRTTTTRPATTTTQVG